MRGARVLIGADVWRGGLAGLLPQADHHLTALYAIAFGLSAGTVFFNPAFWLNAATFAARVSAGFDMTWQIGRLASLPSADRPPTQSPCPPPTWR